MAANSAKGVAGKPIAKFCTSLRKREDWARVVTTLPQIESPKWQESRLTSIDLAVPLGKGTSPGDVFSFVLLSQVDIGKPETEARLDRLAYLKGGRDVGIVFLLSSANGANGMASFQQLQLSMLDKFELPILPLAALEDLASTISAFMGALQAPPVTKHPQPATRTLLPYCTIRPPLPEHANNVLSDISSNFRDLANAAATDQGKAVIRDYMDERDSEGVVDFWLHEYSAV